MESVQCRSERKKPICFLRADRVIASRSALTSLLIHSHRNHIHPFTSHNSCAYTTRFYPRLTTFVVTHYSGVALCLIIRFTCISLARRLWDYFRYSNIYYVYISGSKFENASFVNQFVRQQIVYTHTIFT